MAFVLGIILGILIRDIKIKTIGLVEKTKYFQKDMEKVQFIESITPIEKFKKAKNIGHLLQ